MNTRLILLALATVVLIVLGCCAVHGISTLRTERAARLSEVSP